MPRFTALKPRPFGFDSHRLLHSKNDARRWQRYTWVKPSRATYAELDPAQTHFLDANRLNNSRITDAEVGANSPDTPPSLLQQTLAAVVGAPAARRLSADFALITAVGLILVALLGIARIHSPRATISGFLLSLALTELIAAAAIWMRIARLLALIQIARAPESFPRE
jgi:hypothetical protein